MLNLINQDDCVVYMYEYLNFDKSYPYKFAKNIIKNEDILRKNIGTYIQAKGTLFTDLSYLAIREINIEDFMFYKSKIIVRISGCHGLLISEEPLSQSLYNEISKIIFFEKLTSFH